MRRSVAKEHRLSLWVTMGWSNSLSKWRLRWWHEDQQSFQSPSEPCPEHKMAQANLLAMILEQVEQSTGKPGLFWLKWLEIMGSECSLPWDSESRSPSPTYGRYVHTLYLVQHRFQIIRLLEHSPRLQCQEPGGDETSAFDHICRDASPGYEGRGRTGTYNDQKTILSLREAIL